MRLPDVGELFEGRYRIDSILGEGGFARVYAATSDGVQRRVAIKILKPHDKEGYDPTIVARFLQEARVMSQLRDPHTITMYDCGRSADGLLFMVCELLPGEDLSDLLAARGKLSEAEAVVVLRQILQSLREAHTMGLLHRDIKPGNIRVFEYMGEPLTVKVLDFGIAKSADLATQLTATGRVIGTPRYMSPEQLRGEDLTPASDIYSVGLVAHEMLLGYQERTELVSQVLIKPADLVSRGLRDVVNRMLEREVAARFATAQDVLDALADIGAASASSDAVPARRPPTVIEAPATVPDRPRSRQTVDERVLGPAQTTAQGPSDVGRSGQAADIGRWLMGGVLVLAFAVGIGGFFWMRNAAGGLQRQSFSRADRQFGGAPPQAVLDVIKDPRDQHEPPIVAPVTAPVDVPDVCRKREAGFVGVGTKESFDGIDRASVEAFVPASYQATIRSRVIFVLGTKDERRWMLGDPELREAAGRLKALLVPVSLDDIEAGLPIHTETAKVAAALERAIYLTDRLFCIDEARTFALAPSYAARRLLTSRCELPVAGIITTGSIGFVESCSPRDEIPVLNIHTSMDQEIPGSEKTRAANPNQCIRPFPGTVDAMLATMGSVFMCTDEAPKPLSEGCEQHPCARGMYATCGLETGRLWAPDDRADCWGPSPTTPQYAAAIEAFVEAVAPLATP